MKWPIAIGSLSSVADASLGQVLAPGDPTDRLRAHKQSASASRRVGRQGRDHPMRPGAASASRHGAQRGSLRKRRALYQRMLSRASLESPAFSIAFAITPGNSASRGSMASMIQSVP